eukprot:3985345-Amphidinium_carterae.1
MSRTRLNASLSSKAHAFPAAVRTMSSTYLQVDTFISLCTIVKLVLEQSMKQVDCQSTPCRFPHSLWGAVVSTHKVPPSELL